MNTEKVSVNIGDDKLSAIDLLVDEGLVSNRSAFINEAIDLLLERHRDTVEVILRERKESLTPDQWFIGLSSIDRDYLMQFREAGLRLSLKGFGSLYFAKEIESALITETVAFISRRIRIHGTPEQMRALKEIMESRA